MTESRLYGGVIAAAVPLLLTTHAFAQQLDMDYLPPAGTRPAALQAIQPIPPQAAGTDIQGFGMKPLSVTISKSLYLPPAMYGQWSVVGTLVHTNAPEYFNPVVNDIWMLERVGDQVMISNPANGASAAISVDKVEGNRATFHRSGVAGRNKVFQEAPTITVNGDTLAGTTTNRIRYLKDGQVVREYFAVYQLEANRISAARVQFRPENGMGGPDIEIEEVRRR
jgi:hypothetical protein